MSNFFQHPDAPPANARAYLPLCDRAAVSRHGVQETLGGPYQRLRTREYGNGSPAKIRDTLPGGIASACAVIDKERAEIRDAPDSVAFGATVLGELALALFALSRESERARRVPNAATWLLMDGRRKAVGGLCGEDISYALFVDGRGYGWSPRRSRG